MRSFNFRKSLSNVDAVFAYLEIDTKLSNNINNNSNNINIQIRRKLAVDAEKAQ